VSENTAYAQALARHVKAALLHLRQAEDLAMMAGVDIYASGHDVPAAGLIRAASEAVEDLDLWTINNARPSGAGPADTYPHTEQWCQAPGGSLPAGSWPNYDAAPSLYDAAGTARPALRAELAQLRTARQAWDATAEACTCPPDRCTRGEFIDHAGQSEGCMVCADLDPDQPCYAAVLRGLRAREGQL
jgi:hypothetical protein